MIPEPFTEAQQDAVTRFPLVAEEFCLLIEDADCCDRKQLFEELPVHLARLCEVAAQLPSVEPATEGTDHLQEEITIHTREYTRISEALRKKFGDLDVYWAVFNPTEREEPASGSLAGDITEIYLDLRDSLKLLSTGTALNDIYFEWRFDFREHWSRHLAEALKVLLLQSDSA